MRDWFLAMLWLVLVTVLLCIPGNNLPETNFDKIPFFDKYVHVGLFACLTYSWIRAFLGIHNLAASLVPFLWIGLSIVVYGTLMEFVQKYLVAMRSFDTTDILADTVGVLLGIIVFKKLHPVKSRQH